MSCAYFKQANFDDNGYYTTMNKMLPIGLFSALFLTACGGSDGGGSSAPAAKAYTWQFLHVFNAEEQLDRCPVSATVFSTSVYDDNNGKRQRRNTYAYESSPTELLVSNEFGDNKKAFTSSNITSSGTVSIPENKIESKGYVSSVEHIGLGGGDTATYMLSVQKEMMSDAFVHLQRSPGMVSECYDKNGLALYGKEKLVRIDNPDSNVTKWKAETHFNQNLIPSTVNPIKGLSVVSPNEPVLLSGYNTAGDITHFAYENSNKFDDDINTSSSKFFPIEPISDSSSIQVNVDLNSVFKALSVKSHYLDYSYDWYKKEAHQVDENNTYQVFTPLGGNYNYSIQYRGTNNVSDTGTANIWTELSNTPLNKDENTTMVNVVSPNADAANMLAFECTQNLCTLDASSVADNIQAVKLEYSIDRGDRVHHTIFAKGSKVIVPLLDNRTPYPGSNTKFTVSLLVAKTADPELLKAFTVFGNTRNVNPEPTGGKQELLLPPKQGLQHEKVLMKNEFTILYNYLERI